MTDAQMTRSTRPQVSLRNALRRRLIALWLLGAPALVLSAAWSFVLRSPPPVPGDVTIEPRVSEGNQADENLQPFDPDIFFARLWIPPPVKKIDAAANAPAVAERPSPLNLQLIGIIEGAPSESITGSSSDTPENGAAERKAALYDPQTDTLFIAAVGETLQQHTIVAIAAEYVEFSIGTSSSTQRLDLLRSSPAAVSNASGRSGGRSESRRRGPS